MESKEYIRKAYEKHNILVEKIAETMAFKYNKQAHEVVFVEFYQKKEGEWDPSAWIKNNKQIIVLGNEDIQYVFNAKKLLLLPKVKELKEYRGGKVKGITLLRGEAERLADLVL